MRNLVFILSAYLVTASFSQEKTESTHTLQVSGSTVVIRTNIEDARVFLDGDSLGITPLTATLPAGKHELRIVSPDVASWLSVPIVDSILVTHDTPLTLDYTFPQKFLVLSSPSGAEVIAGDSVLGTTPLVLSTPAPSLRMRKEGYEETTVKTAEAQRGILSAQMKKVWESTPPESIFKDSEESGSSLHLYITGATTVLAGAASAYFKVKADNRYSDYLASGSPTHLSEMNRFDTAAGISLVVTEVSFGLFTYFILSE